MTRFDDKIQLNGSSVEIHRDTGSVEDDYGDLTPIWGKVSDEYVWIRKRSQKGNVPGPAGILDEADYVGYLQSTTSAQDLDMVVDGSTKYRIEKLNEVKRLRAETNHFEAALRKVEEGS